MGSIEETRRKSVMYSLTSFGSVNVSMVFMEAGVIALTVTLSGLVCMLLGAVWSAFLCDVKSSS